MTVVTDEQRAAWKILEKFYPSAARKVAPLLTPELTNPQIALPTEPGHYQDDEGRHWLHQIYAAPGEPYHVDQWLDWNGQNGAPPTGKLIRLVPERPQITRNGVISAILDAGSATDAQADAILALVNGTDRD